MKNSNATAYTGIYTIAAAIIKEDDDIVRSGLKKTIFIRDETHLVRE
jgi:hypothetical protein